MNNTKILVFLSLLMGIGAVLHAALPSIFLTVKPDMMLTMMFLGIILFPNKKFVFLLGAVAGVITALTTGVPGGQIPNIIDKFVTAFVFFGMFLAVSKFNKSVISLAVLTAIGTLISGSIFLGSVALFADLPGSFLTLFTALVLPTAALNTIAIIIVYPIVNGIMKKTSLQFQ